MRIMESTRREYNEGYGGKEGGRGRSEEERIEKWRIEERRGQVC